MAKGSSNKILEKFKPEFFRLAESSQDIFWIRSSDLQEQIYISPAFEIIFGHSVEKLYKTPGVWLESVLIEDRDRVRQVLMEWQSHPILNRSNLAEYRIRHPNGKTIWIRETSFPIFQNDQCVAYAGVAKNVSSEVIAAEEREGVLRYFRHFADRPNTVYWIVNKDNNMLYISKGFSKMMGLERGEIYANSNMIEQFVLPEDRQHFRYSDSFCILQDKPVGQIEERRYRIKSKNQLLRCLRDRRFLIEDDQGELIGLAGVTEDVTQEMQRETELRDAKEMAEKANSAKSDFMAMMSHELRTPLNAILGMTQTMEHLDLDEDLRGQLDVIESAGHRLLSMVRDILDFAKLEMGQLTFINETVEMKQFIEKIIQDMSSQVTQKNVQLLLSYDDETPNQINCDEKRLRQVLVNLLTNAIKFTEEGYIKLKVKCIQKNSHEVTLCFTIEDTGIGIEEEKLKCIFNRFEQVDSIYHRKYEGVGLGLAIVKELVEKMGGSIAVSSEINAGSQFSCIIPFPLSNKSVNLKVETPKKELKESLKNNKQSEEKFDMDILVVEDNLINQRVAKQFLTQLGCRVTIANNAERAIENLEGKNRYDLIFMDIGLPRMNGFEATEVIRKMENKNERTPIVAMTAHVFAHDRERCYEAGMDGVLPKPIMRNDLMKTLGQWRDARVS